MGREYIRQLEIISQSQVPQSVLLEEEFEGAALTWTAVKTGASSTAEVDTTAAYSKAQGAKLYTNEVAGNGVAGIIKDIPPTEKQYLTIRARFRANQVGTGVMYIDYDQGPEDSRSIYEFRLKTEDGEIAYRNSGDTYTVVPGLSIRDWRELWGIIEITIDIVNKKYHSLKVNEQRVSLKDIAPGTIAFHEYTSWDQLGFFITQNEAIAVSLYLDDIVVNGQETAP